MKVQSLYETSVLAYCWRVVNYRNIAEKHALLFTYPESTNFLNQGSEVHFVFMGCGQRVMCFVSSVFRVCAFYKCAHLSLFKTKNKKSWKHRDATQVTNFHRMTV